MFHLSERIITNLTLRFEVVTFFEELNSVEVTYRHVDDIQTLREMLCFGRVLLVHNRFHVRIHLLHRLNRPITVCIPNILHSDNKLKVLSKIRLSGILAYPNGFSNRRVQGVRINEELLYHGYQACVHWHSHMISFLERSKSKAHVIKCRHWRGERGAGRGSRPRTPG